MEQSYQFDLPKHHKSIIKVIGVGGGGSNAVTHMHDQGIQDVEFVVCNTDSQALKSSQVPLRLQIGVHLTEGLGAGANPEVGMNAALESKEEIRDLLSDDTKMVFITAGMGGGTGTGAAPVIAKVAKELDILTVGIVTIPFSFEGKRKMEAAQNGVNLLRENCDTVLVISNDKLREIFGNLSIRDAFAQADNVLTTAAKSIAEVITVTSEVNVDFQDVKTVMANSGPAVMGSSTVSGENRALRAVESALSSPLLNNTNIDGAQKILLSISYGEGAELTMDELTEITDYIEEQAGDGADVIFGQGVDVELQDAIRVTVIATGFQEKEFSKKEPQRKVYDLESNRQINREEPLPVQQPTPPIMEAPRPVEQAQPVRPEPVRPEPPKVQEPQPEQREYEFTFEKEDPIREEPVPEEQPERKVFTLDDDPRPEPKATPTDDLPLFQQQPVDEIEEKRKRLIQQSQERIKRLQELSNQSIDDIHDFKRKLEVPAYKRRNVNLKDVPRADENNVSRYNLDDDNDLLGNNKFLHDNVD